MIKLYEEFINESFGYDKLSTFVKSIIKAEYYEGISKDSLRYIREEFYYTLIRMGFKGEDKITAKMVENHIDFNKLEDRLQSFVLGKAGPQGKSPNKEFVKTFVAAFNKFPKFESEHRGDDLEQKIYTVSSLKKGWEDGLITYTGLDYSDRKKLNGFMTEYEIKEKLTADELKFLQKLVKSKYEALIQRELSDDKIAAAFAESLKTNCGGYNVDNNTKNFIENIRIKNDMPKFFDFVKKEMLGDGIGYTNWKSFEVKTKYVSSDNSAVHSSSFSTYYYYDVDISFMGKKFSEKKVRLGSTYYSGGWD